MSIPEEARHTIDEWLGPGWEARPLAGDASVRAYYRISTPAGATYILAYYPNEVRPQLSRFLGAYEAVSPHGRVPEVLKSCDVAVLQRDVGDRTLYDVLHDDREEGVRLYRAAIDLLVNFQQAPDRALNEPFTASFFLAELEMAREFYVEKLMQADGAPLQPYLISIAENIARHPYVLCHRDYHGQNIHVVGDTLYLIDYQDLRMGPDTYDLASLLRDRGVARILGEETELELVDYYGSFFVIPSEVEGPGRGKRDPSTALGLTEVISLRHRYFQTLLQRSIKILGTFSKQPITRGKMHYLDFIPPTLESIRRCLQELPEYAPLRDIFPLSFDLDRARDRARTLNQE